MAGKINGFSIAYTTVGAVLVWSGIKGTTITTTVQDILKGQAPSQNQEAITTASTAGAAASSSGSASAPVGNTGAATATAAANQAIGKLYAATYGWYPGPQWNALVSLWNQESSWNNNATNPSSGAYGIAQALGHGTATTRGSVTNEYGGLVSDGVAQEANSGSAGAQIAWGLAYIKATYGSPSAAWASETSRGYY